MFTQKELNLCQRRWLELLKDYDMSVLYHPEKDNVVVDALSHMTMGSVSHVYEGKNDLVKDVHRLARLGVRLEDSPNGDFILHHNSDSSLVVELKSKQHIDQPLIEMKESVLRNLNESFFLRGYGVLRYQGRLCVSHVDGLRNRILEKAHRSLYSNHPGSRMMYHDLKEVFWWEGLKKNITEFLAKCPLPTSKIQTSKLGLFYSRNPCPYIKMGRHKYGFCGVFLEHKSNMDLDMLTKSTQFIPIKSTYSAEDYARIFLIISP